MFKKKWSNKDTKIISKAGEAKKGNRIAWIKKQSLIFLSESYEIHTHTVCNHYLFRYYDILIFFVDVTKFYIKYPLNENVDYCDINDALLLCKL